MRGNHVARILLTVAALTGAGCANLFAGKVPPARRGVDPVRRAEVSAAAVEVLRERGFVIAQVDEAGGVIRTAPAVQAGRVPCGFVTCRYRDTVEVAVLPDAAVTVEVKRELDLPSLVGQVLLSRWTAPSRWQKETLAGIEAAQDELLREILR